MAGISNFFIGDFFLKGYLVCRFQLPGDEIGPINYRCLPNGNNGFVFSDKHEAENAARADKSSEEVFYLIVENAGSKRKAKLFHQDSKRLL